MATTKIWKVTDNLNRSVNYVRNPEKTEYGDIRQTLHYIGREEKICMGAESLCFVAGINCCVETAYEEMMEVKRCFGKLGGNLAYHSYQSFRPGEVTPGMCHEIGLKLARKLWGDRYQVVVATHLDRDHLHNHFLLNSVSFIDGKKFNDNKQAYYQLRAVSDELCREYGLSVIEQPLGKTPRNIYFAEKRGEPTKYNLMREAMDTALKVSSDRRELKTILWEMGYELNDDPYRKYATIKRCGSEKAVRLFRLGEEYDFPAIDHRLDDNFYQYGRNMFYWFRKNEMKSYRPPQKLRVVGSATRKIGGLPGLYRLYMYQLGIMPRDKQRRPLSPEMREECRRLDDFSRRVQLIGREGFWTIDDVLSYIGKQNQRLEQLQNERNRCYNRLRRCMEPDEIRDLKKFRDGVTSEMASIRKDRNTAMKIVNSYDKMQENLRAEYRMRKERNQKDLAAYSRQKRKERGRDRYDR